MRAATSVPPPAGKQAISVIWRSGYCACAPSNAPIVVIATKVVSSARRRTPKAPLWLDMRFSRYVLMGPKMIMPALSAAVMHSETCRFAGS